MSEEQKDGFFERSGSVVDETSQHDVLCVMGDLIAKVVEDNVGHERTMGKHGGGAQNDNGGRLEEFCEING